MFVSQMEGAEVRPRTIYSEAAMTANRYRPDMEGYPNSVADVPADETLRGLSFIHGESPEIAVRTGRRAHAT